MEKLSDPPTESDGLLVHVQFLVIEIYFHVSIRGDHEHEHDYEALLPEHFHQFHAAIAVAPLIIIPADHFYEAVTDCQR